MKLPAPLHSWSLSPRAAVALQRELARRVRQAAPRRPVRLVAGVDAAFSADRCFAAAVLWDLERRALLEARTASRRLRFPYIPGLLSFREAPAILAALRRLENRPDALICDGHGLAHPRRFGIACHLGLLSGIPTAGCAKSRLVGEHRAPGNRRGSCARLLHEGEVVGAVLRTRDGVRPLYVSPGHLIDLPSALRLVLRSTVRYRLPEPVRLADQLAGRRRREAGR